MDALAVRRAMKARKPDFMRQDAHKVKRLARKWRKPKGLHSKMRHKFKGYRPLVTKGYKSPAAVRGLSRSGMEMVNVMKVADIIKLDSKKQVAVISRSVGMKKRLVIVEKADEKDVRIINIDQKGYRQVVADFMNQRKERKTKQQQAPEKTKKKEKGEETAQKGAKEPHVSQSPEDIKKIEKKELDKVLTKQEK